MPGCSSVDQSADDQCSGPQSAQLWPAVQAGSGREERRMSCRKTLMVSVTSPRSLSGTSASVPRWKKKRLRSFFSLKHFGGGGYIGYGPVYTGHNMCHMKQHLMQGHIFLQDYLIGRKETTEADVLSRL